MAGAATLTAPLPLLRLFAQLHERVVDAAQVERWLKEEVIHQEGDGFLADLSRVLQRMGVAAAITPVKGSSDKQRWQQFHKLPLPFLVQMKPAEEGEAAAPTLALVGKFSDDRVVVQGQDASKPEVMSKADFLARAGGYGLAVVERDSAAGVGEKFGVRWFLRAIGQYRVLFSEVLLASFFIQVIGLATPLVFQVVIDKVLTHRVMSTLEVVSIALLAMAIFEAALGGMRHYLFSHTTNRVDVELGMKLFRHVLALPLSYFASRRTGDTIARMRELDTARNFLTGQALTAWLDMFFALVFLALMFYYSPLLSTIVVIFLPIFAAASAIISPFLRKRQEEKFSQNTENQSFLVETIGAMETLKSLSVEPRWQREWESRLGKLVQSNFASGHIAQGTQLLTGFLSKLLTVVLLFAGALQVLDGNLTVGGLIAFNMLSGRVNAPILKLASLWQEFTQMKVSVKRLGEVMDASPEPIFQSSASVPTTVAGRIVLEDVSFRYNPKAPLVLRNLSFDIAAGEVVGIVGISGAGKTTLIRLLQRLYVPEEGRISVDGINLNSLDIAWLRRQLGVVGQDALLFNRSVRDNIALADPLMSTEAITAAAELAGATEFIGDLEQGYDTVIGERGSRLSGGQRARLAIARALATDPRILLFDEATASLDYESEKLIHDQMAQICEGRTVLIVAHRLSTLRRANRILVLDRGKLIETGPHHQLVKANGKYADLYRAHLALEKEEAA